MRFQTHRLRRSRMRLDVFLTENGLTCSRTEAKSFILGGDVKVNEKPVLKCSYQVLDTDRVSVNKENKRFVSRGGLKLEWALKTFGVNPEGALALDVGASSGGFTDCLLQSGASFVAAVDSGSGQLADSLRADNRITVIENYNARYMKSSDLPFTPNLCVMDVSFISATHIIPAIYDCLAMGGDYILLVKPQFEVGRSGVGKGGIVRDDKLRKNALDKVIAFAEECGFMTVGKTTSPIEGGDGNIEYLVHFRKETGRLEKNNCCSKS